MKAVVAMLAGAALWGVSAAADTITLHSGVQVHGKIVQQDEKAIVLEVGGRTVRYAPETVALTETNDKTGVLDKEALRQRAAEREAEMLALTGLTAAERRTVNKLMQESLSDDDRVAASARDALIELGKTKPVFKYLSHYVQGLTPRYVPPVLEVLVTLNADEARLVLREQAASIDESVRAKALALLGRIKDGVRKVLLCRVLVDHTDVVRIAAAEAVGVIGAKEATPLLVANVGAADRRVQNSALTALRQIWGGDGDVAALESPESWQQFWESKAGNVPNAIPASGVVPLVEAGTQFVDE